MRSAIVKVLTLNDCFIKNGLGRKCFPYFYSNRKTGNIPQQMQPQK